MDRLTPCLKILIYLIIYLSIVNNINQVMADVENINGKKINSSPTPPITNIQPDLLNLLIINQGKGTFIQRKYFKFLNEPITSEGVFTLHDQKALWQTQSPIFSQLLLTPKAIFSRIDTDDPYQPLLENSEFSLLLSRLISGKFDDSTWQEIVISDSNCVNLKPATITLKKIFSKVQVCLIDKLTRKINLTDSKENNTEIIMSLSSLKIDEEEIVQLNITNLSTVTP